MRAKGYNYSEVTVDGQLLGTWSKSTQSSQLASEVEVKSGQISLFADEYLTINNFYAELTPEQKKKIGTLEDLVNNYEESIYTSEESYIESVKCKL